jgi:23S rRNA pseudouridine1911/1915/1917 synthase
LLKEQSKSSVKSILANRQISVNGRTTTQFDTPLRSGDEVRISFSAGQRGFPSPDAEAGLGRRFLIVLISGMVFVYGNR